jgi:hypothetical protein
MQRTTRTLVGVVLVLVVTVATAAVGLGAAGAGTASGEGEYGPPADEYGAVDRLFGTGDRLNLAGQPIKIQVNAKSGPNGEDAHGTFQVIVETAELGPVSFRGQIHCLIVTGDRAAARGTIERSTSPPNPVGGDYQIQVTDNKSSKSPDTNVNFFGFGPGDVGCPIIEFQEVPITGGNFKVHDATG